MCTCMKANQLKTQRKFGLLRLGSACCAIISRVSQTTYCIILCVSLKHGVQRSWRNGRNSLVPLNFIADIVQGPVQEGRTVNLRHIMDFGFGHFDIHILNTGQIVHTMRELVPVAGLLV